MVPAVTCSGKRDTARDTLKSSDFETVSRFVQATIMIVGFAVMMQGEKWRADEQWEKNNFFRSWKDAGGLQCPVCFYFDCLSTWWS